MGNSPSPSLSHSLGIVRLSFVYLWLISSFSRWSNTPRHFRAIFLFKRQIKRHVNDEKILLLFADSNEKRNTDTRFVSPSQRTMNWSVRQLFYLVRSTDFSVLQKLFASNGVQLSRTFHIHFLKQRQIFHSFAESLRIRARLFCVVVLLFTIHA